MLRRLGPSLACACTDLVPWEMFASKSFLCLTPTEQELRKNTSVLKRQSRIEEQIDVETVNIEWDEMCEIYLKATHITFGTL